MNYYFYNIDCTLDHLLSLKKNLGLHLNLGILSELIIKINFYTSN